MRSFSAFVNPSSADTNTTAASPTAGASAAATPRRASHATGRPRATRNAVDAPEIFGDDATAAAMIDRLVHHAEILALKGDSYRLKDRDLARPPAEN